MVRIKGLLTFVTAASFFEVHSASGLPRIVTRVWKILPHYNLPSGKRP